MAELIPIANLRGPQGNKGDKGDTGIGWGTATRIPQTTDLNTIVTPGLYVVDQELSTEQRAALNYPSMVNSGGSMRANILVLPWSSPWTASSAAVIQEYRNIGIRGQSNFPGVTYRRTVQLTNGVASVGPWSVFTPQRVDNTTGRVIYTWDDTANREQMIYGDTGDRDINDLVDKTIWNVTVAKLRRQNSLVELRLQLSPTTGNTGQLGVFKAQLPAGFRNQHTLQGVGANGANLKPYRIEYTGSQMFIYEISAGSGITLIQQWTTLETWPTALPGTAVGGLPAN